MKPQKDIPEKPCLVCDQLFQPYRETSLICKEYSCKREMYNIRWRKWRDQPGSAEKIKEARDTWREEGGPRRTELLRKYNLTLEEYDNLLKKTGGCQICGKSEADGVKLVVDHCHQTNKLRGILCRGCNASLGQLGDTLESIQNAIEYLENSSDFIAEFRCEQDRLE